MVDLSIKKCRRECANPMTRRIAQTNIRNFIRAFAAKYNGRDANDIRRQTGEKQKPRLAVRPGFYF
jgi:hypothetical protein